MTTPTASPLSPLSALGTITIHRGQLIAVAIIGIVLGIVGLLLPGVSLLTIAILFGIYLVASGIFRINSALMTHGLKTGTRWLFGILGVFVVVAGVICLADPFQSVTVLAYVIGLGWVAEGIVDIMTGIQGGTRPRWFYWLSGVVSVIAGVITFVLPVVAITTFVFIGSILLLFVSVSTLFTLPRRQPKA